MSGSRGIGSALTRRWLTAHGAPGEAIDELVDAALARQSRFPAPVDTLAPALVELFDRLGPALALGTPRRASQLDDEQFARYEQALQQHRNPLVRAAFTLVRHHGMDALYPDQAPTAPVGHPLQALSERILAGRTHANRDFDVIVIGSGAGGAPVAWSLARGGRDVCIVESGALLTPTTYSQAVERHYMSQGMVGSVRGVPLVMAGNAVGGTTVINSGTSVEARPECLRGWDEQAGTHFADELPRLMAMASEKIGVVVPRRELLDASADVMERGLAALGHGHSFVLPRNAPTCRGAGRCCFGCPNGAKQSTDRSFLPEAVEAGATLLWQTRALEIVERADRVEVTVQGREGRRVLRARTLVISAGALSTPWLLRHNRIGQQWKRAGEHLRVHPATKLFGLMPDPLPHGGVPQGLGYETPRLPRVIFEGVHTPAGAAAPVVSAAGPRHKWWMDRYDRLATFGVMVRDRGTGRVRGTGMRRVLDYPLHRDDARDLGASVLLIGEAMFAAGAQRLLLPVAGGIPPEIASMDELRRLRPDDFRPDTLLTTGFHPQGTAGVGRVVDADLRVMGSQRVYVADASVMPDSPGANPQLAIMALALRLAEHLLAAES